MAYGELVYRSRLNLKTTLADLASLVGCERWHTLPKIMKRLREHGLADEQMRALPDEKKHFHRKKTQKRRWQDQLQTTTVYRLAPGAELTDVQNGILWTVHCFNSAGQRPYPLCRQAAQAGLPYGDKHLKWLQDHGYLGRGLVRRRRSPALAGRETETPRRPRGQVGGVRRRVGREPVRRGLLPREDTLYHFPSGTSAVCSGTVARRWHRRATAASRCGTTGNGRFPRRAKATAELLLMEYFVCRMFWDMFDAVERVTKRNRQLGKFHGDNSLGLLRQQTAAQVRAMKARLVEGGVEALETWCPDFSSLGAMRSQPRRQGDGRKATEPRLERHAASKHRCDSEGFDRMLSRNAPELDRAVWLPRLLESRQFQEDPEQLYLECYQALSDLPSRQERNLERLLNGNNGKA